MQKTVSLLVGAVCSCFNALPKALLRFHIIASLLIAASAFNSAWGQTSTFMNWTDPMFSKRSELLPPPPDATAAMKYGGIDVNLATGAVNKVVNLQPFTFRELSIPIYLRYLSNGLSVNTYSSRAGMGWTFEAGGSISRVVHGRDDLNSNRRVPTTNYSANETDAGFTTYCVLLNQFFDDSQPDVFTYNFNGISGKFVFDHDGSIVQMPITNNKIIRNQDGNTSSIWTFMIITPDGTKYYFGGANAKEQTRKEGNGSPNFSSNFSSYIDNVWHLNKIEHRTGYSINLTYQSNSFFYKVGVSDTRMKAPVDVDEGIQVTYYDPDEEMYYTSVYSPQVPLSNTVTEYARVNARLLSLISCDDGSSVAFNYSAEGYPDKLINEVTYTSQQNFITKFKFLYQVVDPIGGTGTKLPFLLNVSQYNNDNVRMNTGYEFDYYNKTSLPPRISFSQDHWGFYNGKTNATLVSAPEESYMNGWFSFVFADRSIDAQYAVNGLLSSVSYPTGGKDEIIYEGNSVTEVKDVNSYAEAYQSLTGTNDNSYVESQGASFTVSYDTKVTLKELCLYTGNSAYDTLHLGGKIIIRNSSNQTVFEKYLKSSPDVNVEDVNLSTGTYTLFVATRGTNFVTEATLRYRTGSAANMQNVNVAAPGMRVKKVLTYEAAASAPIVKRYYYGKLASLTTASAGPISKPIYFNLYRHTGVVEIEGWGQGDCDPHYKTWVYKALHATSLNNIYLYGGSPVNYNAVTESIGGENFEMGAIEHEYLIVADIEAQPIRGDFIGNAPLTNTSYRSGREEKTTVYQKKGSQLLKTERTETEYTDESRKRKDIVCWTIFQRSPYSCYYTDVNGIVTGVFPLMHEAFDAQKYYISSVWSYPKKVTHTAWDMNEQNPMTTVTDYFYDNDTHLQLTRTETTNSKGELVKNVMKYAHDFSQTGNVYENMVNKNFINPPIEIKSYNGSQLLATQTNVYADDWFTDKHLVAQQRVDLQKAGYSNETRLSYTKYDTYGSPLEIEKASDLKQAYIWDYKNIYPIAQIVNADAASVAYTSFEADGKGNWTFSGSSIFDLTSPTGRRAYSLANGSLVKSNLNSGKTYIVSYWSKNGTQQTVNNTSSVAVGKTLNGWKYYEHKVSGNTQYTLSGTGTVDEVRLYPENAAMVTSTYDPGTGVSSQCSVNNNISYYEYDAFNRLTIVRDENRNILKKICYNYQGQIEDCNTPAVYWNSALTVNFTRNNCASGYFGTLVQYVVPAGKYKSTISQQDADNKALNEANTFGQSNANQYGNCVACSGTDKKFINGVCETGIKIITASTQVSQHLWECTYHYEWSDGSWSQNYVEQSPYMCAID